MPIVEISVVPVGTEKPSVSKYVATALEVLKKEKDIKYQLTPMGTVIEADSLKRLLDIARKMHNAVLKREVKRVVTTIKIDDRTDKRLSMAGKIRSVKNKMRDQ